MAKAMAAGMGVYRVESTGRSAAVLLRARTAFASIGSDKLRECGVLEKFSQEFQIDSAPRNAEIAVGVNCLRVIVCSPSPLLLPATPPA